MPESKKKKEDDKKKKEREKLVSEGEVRGGRSHERLLAKMSPEQPTLSRTRCVHVRVHVYAGA